MHEILSCMKSLVTVLCFRCPGPGDASPRMLILSLQLLPWNAWLIIKTLCFCVFYNMAYKLENCQQNLYFFTLF